MRSPELELWWEELLGALLENREVGEEDLGLNSMTRINLRSPCSFPIVSRLLGGGQLGKNIGEKR